MKAKGPSVFDTRTPSEKALAEAQTSYFQGLMGQSDFGYKDETAALDPIYARAQERFQKGVSQAGAERGFGALRQGPQLSAVSRGLQEMQENRAAQEAMQKDAYKRWVFSQGRETTIPVGRSVQPGSPSAFSQLLGPVATGVGYGLGGPLGGALAGGFAGMLSPKGQGFGAGFGQGAEQYYSRPGYAPIRQ